MVAMYDGRGSIEGRLSFGLVMMMDLVLTGLVLAGLVLAVGVVCWVQRMWTSV
jgi:hypothetical protein